MITINLSGKTAIITGAARGIGRSIALALAEAGANAALGDLIPLEQLSSEIKERFNVDTITFKVNVTSMQECNEFTKAVQERFGRIDILVNNAGITRDSLLIRLKEEDWDSVLAVNLRGTFNMSRCVVPIMLKQRWGRIINISSIVGITGNAGQTNYAASKAGVIAFTKSLAKEVGSRNITVNAIAPGFIRTDMTNSLPDEVKNKMLSAIALGRPGEPADVARVTVFLASSLADYITGQTIIVDGGLSG